MLTRRVGNAVKTKHTLSRPPPPTCLEEVQVNTILHGPKNRIIIKTKLDIFLTLPKNFKNYYSYDTYKSSVQPDSGLKKTVDNSTNCYLNI